MTNCACAGFSSRSLNDRGDMELLAYFWIFWPTSFGILLQSLESMAVTRSTTLNKTMLRSVFKGGVIFWKSIFYEVAL